MRRRRRRPSPALPGQKRPRSGSACLAFVLLHNDAGGHEEAAHQVVATFGNSPGTHMHTWLVNLRANFDDPDAPGPDAYVTQLRIDHPEADLEEAAADAVLAVTGFCDIVAGT